MPYCPGCGKEFTYNGISIHLARTKDPSCCQIYDALYQFDSSDLASGSTDDGRGGSSPLFEGDFFGTADQYHSDDFNWNDNDHKMVVDDGDGIGDEIRDGIGDGDGDGDGGGCGCGCGVDSWNGGFAAFVAARRTG